MTTTVTVRSTATTNRALLWERRPDGDIWITADGMPHAVPLTAAVQRLIDAGDLVVASTTPEPDAGEPDAGEPDAGEPEPDAPTVPRRKR